MKRNALQAVIACKCPKCRQGNMFQYNSFLPGKFDKVEEVCSHCGLRYESEPGFFTGAMYVSYALVVAVLITIFTALNILDLYTPILAIGLVVVSIVLLVPVFFRYSRVLFLHLFGNVQYDSTLNK